MNEEIIGKLPELKSFGDDLSKIWYVRFSQRDPKSGKLKRIKVSGAMNRHLTVRARYAEAKRLITHYSNLMNSGWSYFENREKTTVTVVNVQKNKYQELRAKNKTFEYYANHWIDNSIRRNDISKISIKSYTGPVSIICDWLKFKKIDDNDISAIFSSSFNDSSENT